MMAALTTAAPAPTSRVKQTTPRTAAARDARGPRRRLVRPVRSAGDDAEVEAGDDDDVGEAGGLQVRGERGGEGVAGAEEHAGGQAGLGLGHGGGQHGLGAGAKAVEGGEEGTAPVMAEDGEAGLVDDGVDALARQVVAVGKVLEDRGELQAPGQLELVAVAVPRGNGGR